MPARASGLGRLLDRFRGRGAGGRRPERTAGGDELWELAKTFRVTVERLSSLMRELEAAHQRALSAEVEKKRFYREVIRAVTHGKFELVDPTEVPDRGRVLAELPLSGTMSYPEARAVIRTAAVGAGMSEERTAELVLAAGEAITNAFKHATGAEGRVYATEDAVGVRVSDRGPGIRAHDLPAALLWPGFSTKVSLGMGYTMMLRLSDRLWLATGPEGTVVQLEKQFDEPQETPVLQAFPDL